LFRLILNLPLFSPAKRNFGPCNLLSFHVLDLLCAWAVTYRFDLPDALRPRMRDCITRFLALLVAV
jgi:hypothetical protein